MKELNNKELVEFFGGSVLSNVFWDFCSYIFHAPAIVEMRNSAGGSPVNFK